MCRQAEWGDAFDCPVLIPEADREWVMRPEKRITYWIGALLQLLLL